jgi:hypothetical protein
VLRKPVKKAEESGVKPDPCYLARYLLHREFLGMFAEVQKTSRKRRIGYGKMED